MQDVEAETFLVDWNAFDRAGKSRAKPFVAVAHELNSFADCERNTSECVQSPRQIRESCEVRSSKKTNGVGQEGSREWLQRERFLADSFLH